MDQRGARRFGDDPDRRRLRRLPLRPAGGADPPPVAPAGVCPVSTADADTDSASDCQCCADTDSDGFPVRDTAHTRRRRTPAHQPHRALLEVRHPRHLTAPARECGGCAGSVNAGRLACRHTRRIHHRRGGRLIQPGIRDRHPGHRRPDRACRYPGTASAAAMNPRALGAWALAGVTIALATGNPIYRVLVLLCALNVLIALRRPGVSLRGLLVALARRGSVSRSRPPRWQATPGSTRSSCCRLASR